MTRQLGREKTQHIFSLCRRAAIGRWTSSDIFLHHAVFIAFGSTYRYHKYTYKIHNSLEVFTTGFSLFFSLSRVDWTTYIRTMTLVTVFSSQQRGVCESYDGFSFIRMRRDYTLCVRVSSRISRDLLSRSIGKFRMTHGISSERGIPLPNHNWWCHTFARAWSFYLIRDDT